jgi:rubrerythrin
MDIFEFAIQMEQDGQRFYRDLAQRTTHNSIQNILTMLADDETKHEQAIVQMRAGTCMMTQTTILDKAKNIFQQMRDFGGDFDLSGDEEKLYRQAMEMEQKSIDFYLDRSEQVETDEQRALFSQLAREEEKHYQLLSNLVDFVAAPKTWLADAEFERLGDY